MRQPPVERRPEQRRLVNDPAARDILDGHGRRRFAGEEQHALEALRGEGLTFAVDLDLGQGEPFLAVLLTLGLVMRISQ